MQLRHRVPGVIASGTDRPIACVLGDLDLVRPLAKASIPCAVVAPPGSTIAWSHFCRDTISSDEQEISDHGDELVGRLIAFARGQSARPVLFYQEDEQLLFVSRNRDRLAEHFRFVIADPDLVEGLVDKARFHSLAERLNLPVPATREVHPVAGSVPPALDLRFPLIAKPLWRRRSWGESGYAAKAVPIAAPEDLRDWWPRWARDGLGLLIQEMVPGPESRIESYHVYVDRSGEVAAEFTGRKIRTWPLEFGHSTALVLTDAADVAALGRSLVALLGLRGVAKFDFKRAPEGRLYLLEVNARFTLWHHLGAVAGVNVPALVYRDLIGEPRAAAGASARAGARWCRVSEDWRAAGASGVPLHRWALWALNCDAKSVVWNDPLPFLLTAHDAVSRRMIRRGSPKAVPEAGSLAA